MDTIFVSPICGTPFDSPLWSVFSVGEELYSTSHGLQTEVVGLLLFMSMEKLDASVSVNVILDRYHSVLGT